MKTKLPLGLAGVLVPVWAFVCGDALAESGELLPVSTPGLTVWWAPSSATKIRPETPAPQGKGAAIMIQSARNEWEAACLVLRSADNLGGLRLSCGPLRRETDAPDQGMEVEVLQVKYLNITRATDGRSKTGSWPDPLLSITGPLDLGAGSNHVFWLRIFVPRDARAGTYRSLVKLEATSFSVSLPLELTVFDFGLPDRKSCTTAFGFSAAQAFRYHGLKTEEQKRLILDKYLSNLAAHHVSPYDPAPLDQFKVRWPEVRPPKSTWDDWRGLHIVTNEVHGGQGALLVYDDQPGENTTVQYEPLIPIPSKGFRFRGWCRTAVPGHRFLVSFNHYDANRQWMSGRNNDLSLAGTGRWQQIDVTFTHFPEGARFVRVHLRATLWSDHGEHIGLVWFDDLSLTDHENGRELLSGGDFERKSRTELAVAEDKLRVELDFQDWDRSMARAMEQYHFTSFQVQFPGLGGGTFHEIDAPNLLGFREDDPEYPLLMASYGRQVEAHLRERGWLDRAFVYWFDEPDPGQYPFVMNGFAKLKRYAPGLTRMLTEQVEPGLIGGPNLWCPISNEYRHEAAESRRAQGEKFWWYVCTGPKAPYAGLFIDHPAPEMRIWVWQSWQRRISGLLVWQINYWTSGAAYPDKDQPQNPYDDPMSWTSGYSTPAGKRLPWGNGDGRFIYPPLAAANGKAPAPVLAGPVDSIRWEQLRDGIEDYEYLSILKERLERARSRLSASELAAFGKLLEVPESITRSMTEFTSDGAPIEARRKELARAIEKLNASVLLER